MITVHKEMITASRLREVLHYEKNTGVMTWVAPPKNHTRMLGKAAGSQRNGRNGKRYIWVKVDGAAYSLSRLAFLWVTGEFPKEEVDHKNGNSLDNRWDNLREATHTQNTWNRRANPNRLILPMGVRIVRGKFQARITKNKVVYHLGVFPFVDQAKRAYESKRKELFGEFA